MAVSSCNLQQGLIFFSTSHSHPIKRVTTLASLTSGYMDLPIWHVFTLASQAKHSHHFKYQKCIYLYWSLWRHRVCLKLGLLLVAEHFGDQQLLYTLCLNMLVITNICNLCLKSCVFVCALLCFWVSKDLSFIGAGY